MALITCEKCGKKYSDTISVCIHCGHNPAEAVEKADKIIKDESNIQATVNEATKSPSPIPETHKKDEQPQKSSVRQPAINFNKLSLKERERLENEFLVNQPKRLKYEKKRHIILHLLGMTVQMTIVCLVIALGWGMLVSQYANNYALYDIVIKVSTSGFAIGIIVSILLSVIFKVYSASRKSDGYLEAYKAWLKNEKNIIK